MDMDMYSIVNPWLPRLTSWSPPSSYPELQPFPHGSILDLCVYAPTPRLVLLYTRDDHDVFSLE
jgi:hypothetical protein